MHWEEEVPPDWVEGNSKLKESPSWGGLAWIVRKDTSLVAKNLIANLLGQDMLGQMDTVVTMDHWAFYKDMLNEGEKST